MDIIFLISYPFSYKLYIEDNPHVTTVSERIAQHNKNGIV
jgi:hypothetical protein